MQKIIFLLISFIIAITGPVTSQDQINFEDIKTETAFKSIADLPEIDAFEKNTTVAPDRGPAVVFYSSAYKEDNWTESRFTVVRRLKVLEEAGKKHGIIRINMHPLEYFENFEGRIISPEGIITALGPDTAREIRVDQENIWGAEIIYQYNLPDIEVGTIIEYSFTITSQLGLGFRFNNWQLQEDIHVHDNRFTLDMPKDFMPYEGTVVNLETAATPSVEETDERKLVTYKFVEITSLIIEPLMPPPTAQYGRLIIGYEWTRSNTSKPLGFWMQVGQSQARKVSIYMEKSTHVRNLARSIVEYRQPPKQKVKIINSWIRQNIRNLSAEPEQRIGEEDYTEDYYKESIDLDQVIQTKRGTSIEITYLAVALMQEAGLDAFLALAVGREKGILQYSFLDSRQLDQAMVAIRLPDNSALFTQPGTPGCPDTAVSWYVQGVIAIICTPRGGIFARIPVTQAEENEKNYQVTMQIDQEGNASGTIEVILKGQHVIDYYRRKKQNGGALDFNYLFNGLHSRFQNAQIKKLDVADRPDKPEISVLVAFYISSYVNSGKNAKMLDPDIVRAPELEKLDNGYRTHPVYLPYPYTENLQETIRIHENQDARLPESKILHSDIGHLQTYWQSKNEEIVWNRKLSLKRVFFNRKETNLLSLFFQQVTATAQQQQVQIISR